MKALLYTCLLFAVSAPAAWSQRLAFPKVTATDDAALANALPALAKQVIAVYTDTTQDGYLNNLFRLQMVAGDYSGAHGTLEKLRTLNETANSQQSIAMLTPDELTVRAKLLHQSTTGSSFNNAMAVSFRDLFGRLDDKAASDAIYWLWGPVWRFRNNVAAAVTKSNAAEGIELPDALDLIRSYQLYLEYGALIPLTDALIQEDDAKRYVIQRDVQVRTADGATLCTLIVRSKHATGPQPTALNFTVYAGPDEMGKARQAAVHGYVGVVADARGKACSPDQILPWEVEAQDTYGVIDWISKQPWSDGQVGMLGGSYDGFSQWAAVKHVHPALKTIVPWGAVHPGLVLPMSNNVFQNANYQWASYVTDSKYLDDKANGDQERWNRLNSLWYQSGKPYRDIDKVDGVPNTLLQRQLLHPAFDRYWQAMTPYQNEFAHIHIPVLQITGYFDPAQIAATYYLAEHYKYNSQAEHYLIIGPYDHFGAQAAEKPAYVNGYAIDPVAAFNTPEITYQWFDYVMKGGKKPDVLQDKINFEVMGANLWRHAPSLKGMSNDALTLYLSNESSGVDHDLTTQKPSRSGFLEQRVDFADRAKAATNHLYPDGVEVKNLHLENGFTFIGDPLRDPITINGAIGGVIRASINKRDMDVTLAFYELTPDGDYFNLGYYKGRASFSHDRAVRHLLKPGRIESIPIMGTPLVSRQIRKGSRLLVQLTVNKNEFDQLNYGTGTDVSDESIADAKTPLQVRWQNDSYITVPIWK
jgi:putative CocE/NonD family hydrolase